MTQRHHQDESQQQQLRLAIDQTLDEDMREAIEQSIQHAAAEQALALATTTASSSSHNDDGYEKDMQLAMKMSRQAAIADEQVRLRKDQTKARAAAQAQSQVQAAAKKAQINSDSDGDDEDMRLAKSITLAESIALTESGEPNIQAYIAREASAIQDFLSPDKAKGKRTIIIAAIATAVNDDDDMNGNEAMAMAAGPVSRATKRMRLAYTPADFFAADVIDSHNPDLHNKRSLAFAEAKAATHQALTADAVLARALQARDEAWQVADDATKKHGVACTEYHDYVGPKTAAATAATAATAAATAATAAKAKAAAKASAKKTKPSPPPDSEVSDDDGMASPHVDTKFSSDSDSSTTPRQPSAKANRQAQTKASSTTHRQPLPSAKKTKPDSRNYNTIRRNASRVASLTASIAAAAPAKPSADDTDSDDDKSLRGKSAFSFTVTAVAADNKDSDSNSDDAIEAEVMSEAEAEDEDDN
jgi:hypothetical protein